MTGDGEDETDDSDDSGEIPEEENPNPSIDLVAPVGSDELEISRDTIDQSATENRDITISFPGGEGEEGQTFTLPAFDAHEQEALGGGTLSVIYQDGRYMLCIRVPREETEKKSYAGVTHNLVSFVRKENLDVWVYTEDEPENSFLLTRQDIHDLADDDLDILVEFDREQEEYALVLEAQTAAHGLTDSAIAPAAAFTLAKEHGLNFIFRIYDTDTGEEPWYEWVFTPEALADVEPADTDLYVRAAPEDSDPILSMTQGKWCQYIITNHEGALPANAILRVKNLEEFPTTMDMSLIWANGSTMETMATGLYPDENGWYQFKMEHCSSYALIETVYAPEVTPELQESEGEFPWFWLLILGGVLLLLILIMVLVLVATRKNKPEHRSAVGYAKSVIDIDWEDVEHDGRTET